MVDKMLTPNDIRELVGNVKLIKFHELADYDSIEQVLPKQKDSVIIFWETESENVGHYTSLCRFNQTYVFFDSYGNTEQEDFSYIPMSLRNELGIEKDYLKTLLKDKHVISNRIDFQQMKDGVNTCGRFVAMFLYCCKRGYSLADFQKIMKKKVKDFKNYDEMAVYYTS